VCVGVISPIRLPSLLLSASTTNEPSQAALQVSHLRLHCSRSLRKAVGKPMGALISWLVVQGRGKGRVGSRGGGKGMGGGEGLSNVQMCMGGSALSSCPTCCSPAWHDGELHDSASSPSGPGNPEQGLLGHAMAPNWDHAASRFLTGWSEEAGLDSVGCSRHEPPHTCDHSPQQCEDERHHDAVYGDVWPLAWVTVWSPRWWGLGRPGLDHRSLPPPCRMPPTHCVDDPTALILLRSLRPLQLRPSRRVQGWALVRAMR
jgi:hypothetical protein